MESWQLHENNSKKVVMIVSPGSAKPVRIGNRESARTSTKQGMRVALVGPTKGFRFAWDVLRILRKYTPIQVELYTADTTDKARGRFDIVHAIGIRSIIPALTIRAKKRIYSSTVRTFRENVAVLKKCYHGTYEPYIDGSFIISNQLCQGKRPKWTTFPSLNTARTGGEIPTEVLSLSHPLLVWARRTRTNSPQSLLRVWKDVRLHHPTATLLLPGGYLNDRELCMQPGVVVRTRTRPEDFAGILQAAVLVYSFGVNKGVGNATIAAMKLGKPVMFLTENLATQLKHNVNAYQTKDTEEDILRDTLYVLDNLNEITTKYATANAGLSCIGWGNCGKLMHTMYQEILGEIAPRSTMVLYKRITKDLPW